MVRGCDGSLMLMMVDREDEGWVAVLLATRRNFVRVEARPSLTVKYFVSYMLKFIYVLIYPSFNTMFSTWTSLMEESEIDCPACTR